MIGKTANQKFKSVSLLMVFLEEERDEIKLCLNESVWLEAQLRFTFKRRDGLCLIEVGDGCLSTVTVDGSPVVNSLFFSSGQELKINGKKLLMVPRETYSRKRKLIHSPGIIRSYPVIYFAFSVIILFSGLSLLERAGSPSSSILGGKMVSLNVAERNLTAEINELESNLKRYGDDKSYILRKIEVLSHLVRDNPKFAKTAFVKIHNSSRDKEVLKLTESIIERL